MSEMTLPYIIEKSSNSNQEYIDKKLKEFGAVLLRGFNLHSSQDFSKYVDQLYPNLESFSYTGGTSPRSEVLKEVYTSTKMPFMFSIAHHPEMAYQKSFPSTLFFFCKNEPWIKGETRLADLRKVDKSIPRSLRDKVCEKQILYNRHLKSYTKMRRFLAGFFPMFATSSWQFVFKTEDKKQVELFCKKNQMNFTWNQDNSLSISNLLPGEHSGIWFNCIHFFQLHPKIWGYILTVITKLFSNIFKFRIPIATLGDGSLLTDEEISQIILAYKKNEVKLKWRKGDLLIINNNIISHGRNWYIGQREIMVKLKGVSTFTSPA